MQDQSKNNQDLQWLPWSLVQKLFTATVREYQAETYDINAVARAMIIQLDIFKESDKQQKAIIDKKTCYEKQIIYFCSLLGGAPRYFIQLLNQQIISSRTTIITLNSKNQIIAYRFFKDFQIFGKKLTKIPDYLSIPEINNVSHLFFNTVAHKISKLYTQCCEMINDQMERLTEKVKNSKMMNNFLLYKIFRQISEFYKIMVQDKATQSVFRHCQKEVIQQFFRYLINKFQIITFFTNQQFKINPPLSSTDKFIQKIEQNQHIEFAAKQAINSQGKFAIFLKTYANHKSEINNMDDYLILLNNDGQVEVLNCKTLRKKWFVLGPVHRNFKFQTSGPIPSKFKLSKNSKEYLVEVQKQVDIQRSNKKQTVAVLFKGKSIDNYTNTNGVIGRCLYLMKSYNGVSEFFKDLSKRALISRSISQIMSKVPIVGYMIFAGTFSANFYQIFSNRFSTEQRKLKQLGGLFINTGATVGTSILGAIAGQMLIPIPFFGALIGTVIGGYLGDKGTKKITSVIENKRFGQIMEYLRNSQINKRYWLYTKQLNSLLEIKESAFQKYLPGHMSEQVFASLICFVLVCFHESRRLNKFNLQKVQTMAKSDSKKQHGAQGQDEFQAEVMKLSVDQNYQADFNMTSMIDYLQQNSASVYQHYNLIEKSILTFLNKIN